MSQNNILRYNKNIVSTCLSSGDGVLLDLNSKMYYELNKTGMQIWETVDGCAYDSVKYIDSEISSFIDFLLQESLLELALVNSEQEEQKVCNFILEEKPTITRHEPLTKVTAFTAASAGGATFF